MDSYRKAIGKRLRTLRKLKGLSQDALAEAACIDPKSISRMESGAYFPALDTLIRFSSALEVPLKDFFVLEEDVSDDQLRSRVILFACGAERDDLNELNKTINRLSAK